MAEQPNPNKNYDKAYSDYEKAEKKATETFKDLRNDVIANLHTLTEKGADGKYSLKKGVDKVKDVIYAFGRSIFQYFLEVKENDLNDVLGKMNLSKLYFILSKLTGDFIGMGKNLTDYTQTDAEAVKVLSGQPDKGKPSELLAKISQVPEITLASGLENAIEKAAAGA